MSTADDEVSSGINGRLRPRKSYVSRPQTTKSSRKVDSKPSQEKSKRVSTPSKNPLINSDDLSKKSDCSSVVEYLCPYCDKNFVSKKTASKHAQRIHFSSSHQQDTFIDCLYCNHTEAEPNDIFKHMIDSHPNQYFACLDCHTRFLSTKELAEHKLNVCERQKLQYRSKLRPKSTRTGKKSQKLDRQVVIREEERHGYNGIVISCELKPTHVTDTADIEDNITTNLILPSSKGNKVIDKNAVILLDGLQWNKRIPHNFSFHNTDTDQILSRLGVVHRSPRTGESTRKDWFKTIDDATQKFERCFDTNFYSKVASNIHENLSKFLDGSFNFNPDPNHTIKTRKAKNSVPINTVEGFPILLSCEQYSRNLFDGYMPRAIAPKHKWKWDNLENDRNSFNADQMKRDSHVNNCIVTLVSSLDIWTQLYMRQKFEDKFKTTPLEKKTEKQKIISNELKEILESRQLPDSAAQVSRSNCSGLVKVREDLDFPTSLGLTPTTTAYEIQPAVLSGEWVRPRCYVCCACGAQTRDPRALSAHISTQHPNAQVQHYEIPGELFLNVDILKHLYVPPSPVPNRTRPPRGFRECTKCNKSITIEDLHQHMLDCAGDMPTVRRKCRYRQFGMRKRRTRIQDNRMRKKMRKDIHRSNGRPRSKIRTEVGDAETIRKMLADLPAKRHRVIITPISSSLKSKKKMIKQLGQITFKKRLTEETKNRKMNIGNNSQSSDMLENSEIDIKNIPEDNKNKPPKNKFNHRSAILDKKALINYPRKGVKFRQDFDDIELGSQPAADSTTSSQNFKIQVLSTENQPNRINVNSGSFNTREQANRSNNDGSNNRENHNPDRNDDNGNFRDQGAPPQNIPLKHSIARLTADTDTQDKAVQFHHLFLVQQECNNVTQHVPSGQPVLFENKAVTVKLDKPPLDTFQKSVSLDAQNSQKNKSNKQRKGLNDCIAMLKNKLIEPVKAPDVSIQCKIDETSPSNHEPKKSNRMDITVQCPDDNHETDILITPRYINSINEVNVIELKKQDSYLSLQGESTKHNSELVPTHKEDLNIEITSELAHNKTSSLIGIKDVSQYKEINRNDFTVAQNNQNPPPDYANQLKDEISVNVDIIQKVTDSDVPVQNQDKDHLLSQIKEQKCKKSKDRRYQDIKINSINNEIQTISAQKHIRGETAKLDLECNHREANVYHEQNEVKNKMYRSDVIPLAHNTFGVESTAPLDLSGKLYVNEVIAHSSKQEMPRNISDDPYETLDLSNKGIKKHIQRDATEAYNEVVVDLRVKHTISTQSEGLSIDSDDNRIIPTDLSLKHTGFRFAPTDLSIKGNKKPAYFNDVTRKDVNINDIHLASNLTCSQNNSVCLNLSSNEGPTDLSQKSLKMKSTKLNSSRESTNYKSLLNLENDLEKNNSEELRHQTDNHVITTGKNIVHYRSPEVQSTSSDVIISMIKEQKPSAKTTKWHYCENIETSQPVIMVDKVPINLSKSSKESSRVELLHKQLHVSAITPLQSHGSKTIDNLNTPSTIPQPSINITSSYCNTAEFESSIPVMQKITDKQNDSEKAYQTSKSRWPQENQKELNYEISTSATDHDPETAKKIALLPKELVEILGNMPVDHRNQLLNVLPQYVSISATAAPKGKDAFDDTKLLSHRHTLLRKETDISQTSQYPYSGLPNSQRNVVDMYQIQQSPPNYHQPHGKNKKPSDVVHFSSSLEASIGCLSAGHVRRGSIDLSGCNIIDLTDENIETKSAIISPEKENKNERLAIKSIKTNNDKTASLRAVRIKAPSERAKSIVSESQFKKLYLEKSNIFRQNSDYSIEPAVVPQSKINTIKETNIASINSTATVISLDLGLNTRQLSSSELFSESKENATAISSSVITASDILDNNPVLEIKEISSNPELLDRDKIKTIESEMPHEINIPTESNITSSLKERKNENTSEDDSEDEVSLAVMVKQKQREISHKIAALPNNDVNANMNKYTETKEKIDSDDRNRSINTLVSKHLISEPSDDRTWSTINKFPLVNQNISSDFMELKYQHQKNMKKQRLSAEPVEQTAIISSKPQLSNEKSASEDLNTDNIYHYNTLDSDDSKRYLPSLEISVIEKHKDISYETQTLPLTESFEAGKITPDKILFKESTRSSTDLTESKQMNPLNSSDYFCIINSRDSQDSQTIPKTKTLAIPSNNNTIAETKKLIDRKKKENIRSGKNFDTMNAKNEITESFECSSLEKDTLTTRLRRSRRGKSLSLENNDVNSDSNISVEQRGPLTKKQLIFSKLLQDEENTVMKNAHSTGDDEEKREESELDCETFDIILDMFKKRNKEKNSEAVNNKQKKTKFARYYDNPTLQDVNTKETKNKGETPNSMISSIEFSQIKSDENKLDYDAASKSEVIHTEKNTKITGKRIHNTCNINEVLSSKTEINKSTIDNANFNALVNSDASVYNDECTENVSKVISVKHIKKPKSVLVKPTSVTCDPDYIQLLDTGSEEMDSFLQNEAVSPKNRSIVEKPEFNSATDTFENCAEATIHEHQAKQNTATGRIVKTKELLNHSDESAADDEVKRNFEENEKNKSEISLMQKSQKQPFKTSSKQEKKTLPYSNISEKHDTENTVMKSAHSTSMSEEKIETSEVDCETPDIIFNMVTKERKEEKSEIKSKQKKTKPINDTTTYQNENTREAYCKNETPILVNSAVEVSKTKYDDNKLNCNIVSESRKDISVKIPTGEQNVVNISEKVPKITEKRKSSSYIMIDEVLTSKVKKIKSTTDKKTINNDDSDDNGNNLEYGDNVCKVITQKNIRKPAERRCRSKSVLVKSICKTYDPYDIDLLDSVVDVEPFLKREDSNKSSVYGKVNNIDSEHILETNEIKSPSTNTLNKSADESIENDTKTLPVTSEKNNTENTVKIIAQSVDEDKESEFKRESLDIISNIFEKAKKEKNNETKKKHKKKKPLNDKPILELEYEKVSNNKDETSIGVVNSDEASKTEYNENNSNCDKASKNEDGDSCKLSTEDKTFVITSEKNPVISEISKHDSFSSADDVNNDNSDVIVKKIKYREEVSKVIPAARRCRSKSVLVGSTSKTYDPYDIDLLDAVVEVDPFLKRKAAIRTSISKKSSKCSTFNDNILETSEFNSPSTSIPTKSTDKVHKKQENKCLLSKTKGVLSDSDESSKSDEPLKKYVKKVGKKKSQIKRLDKGYKKPCKTLRKRKKKIHSVTSEKLDTEANNTSRDDNEERMRSEQFMESFGFFSERKPRKSNLLATKKIAETFHLINSFYESEDKSIKKNVNCENRKTTDVEGNLKEPLNTSSKKVSKRGRKKKVSTKIEPSYCEVCRKEFRRPDNFLRHQLSLAHVTRVSEVELKVKNVSICEESNYLVIYKQQLDRLKILQDKITRRKKYCKSLENIALPSLEDIIADVTRTVRQQQLAHRGLSRDEALFLDCCELLNASHNDDKSGRPKDSVDCKINCYTCSQASSESLNVLEKRINDLESKCDDGDVDSITAQDILESEEVRNLENDLITGLKEAAACASNFNSTPINSFMPEVRVDSKQVNTTEHSKDIEIINPSDETKIKKMYEVKDKMYPDVIENIDMFEDKFDKIKRKCRSQAAKQTQYVETSRSSKTRKKVEKKKRRKSRKKKNSQGSVPTKGALKGFEGVKVSILTSEINMASILASSSKKKKRSNSKRKKDRKNPENFKYNNDDKCKDPQKKVDVYEFMDNEDAELFDFRPSTLMERFKSISNKDTPSTSKSQPINIDPEISIESASDGDDFVYMSDDYICSEAETENSLMSCELGNVKASPEMKKPLPPSKRKDMDKNEKTEKNAVMGKIFKHNAVRTEKKIVKIKEPEKLKANLDQLFDSLLEKPNSSILAKSSISPRKEDEYNFEYSQRTDNIRSNHGAKSVKSYEHERLDDSDIEPLQQTERTFSPVPYTSFISHQKRRKSATLTRKEEFAFDEEDEYTVQRSPATSRGDEDKFSFESIPTTLKHKSRKKKEVSYISFDDVSSKHETKRRSTFSSNYDDDSLLRLEDNDEPSPVNISYNKRKSKEKEFKLKSTISDFDYNDEILDNTGVARQRARRKCTVGKQNILAETWSSESEPDGIPQRPNSTDSVGGLGRKKKSRKKDGQTLGGRKSNNRQVLSKCEGVDNSTRSSRNSLESFSRVVPTSRPSAVCSNSKVRHRPVPYYWSDEEEPEHVQQHGWIVGDSHKKLVTMLAHAKGKRNNDDKRHCVE